MSRQVKKVLFASLALFMMIALTACGGSNSSSSSSDGKVELTMWIWPGMGLEELIAQYEEENENIKVNIQTAEFNDVHTNLTTALAAGSGAPDISAIEVKGIDRMKGTPQHFNNLYDLGAEELKGDYLDWKWQQGETMDGETLLGIPTDIGPQAMVYNLEIFEAAGLPTDREEVEALIQTWDDYVRVAEQVKETTGKYMLDAATGMFAVMKGQGKEKYFNADGELIIDSNPQIEKAWNYTLQMIEKDLVTPFDQWSTEWSTGIANGDFATILAPAWMMNTIQDNAPDGAGKWDIAALPEGSGNWGGSFLTIPKESKHPEEAYALIKWLLSPEQQLKTFEIYGNFPSTPSVFDSEAMVNYTNDYFNGAPVGQIYAKAAEQVQHVIEGPESIQVESILNDAVNRVRDGQQDPTTSWQTALDQLEREIGR
ncbi:ABC transporter substrate-binding protein [Halalkalibacter akibai]|uniref:Sugar transport system n=1 Tax=Halalkalibacter akibai (strain ATCC 43226 / DSM 21942 / CIP 109018 / JCM 9157 / 1139) TaxID=1236973 RepID=W4QXL6_HALA3|nr:extracellular solute-binding protein [Halalkalibacter akibai]GAE36383.1 sugar transport system [Halalkalibacter akibai JCM 9157]